MNEIGKPIKELQDKQGIVEIDKGKYRILRKGFDWGQVFSDKYCVVGQEDLEERLGKFLLDNQVNAEIKKVFLGRFEWLLRVKTDIKVDDFEVVFRIQNSTNKARSFGFDTYLYDFKQKYVVPVVATETLACLSFHKRHIGRIEISELLKNLKVTIDFIKENIQKLRRYVEVLKDTKVDFYQIQELLNKKDEKGRNLYAKQLQEIMLPPLKYYYWKEFNKDYSQKISILVALQVIQRNLLWRSPAVIDRVIASFPRVLSDLAFESLYGGF